MPVRDVVLRVDDNKAPTGADLLVDVVVAGVKVITGVKIAAGATAGGTLAFAELGFIAADTPVSIDITQVAGCRWTPQASRSPSALHPHSSEVAVSS